MDFAWPLLDFGLFGLTSTHLLALPSPSVLLSPPLPNLVTQLSLGTWMCTVGESKVTICGPPAQATNLLQQILGLGGGYPRPSSPRDSEGSFDLVSSRSVSAAPTSLPAPREETRAEIEATFDICPTRLLDASSRLSGSSLSGEERIKRAWKAGQWAKAGEVGRIRSPNRTPQLDLRPRFFAVVRARGITTPTLCRSSGTYWGIVGDLSSSSSITHGFPSELESKAYFAGAGITEFDTLA